MVLWPMLPLSALAPRWHHTLCLTGTAAPSFSLRRLMEMVRHRRLDLTSLLIHRFDLNQVGEAYRIFGERLAGVLKFAVKP